MNKSSNKKICFLLGLFFTAFLYFSSSKFCGSALSSTEGIPVFPGAEGFGVFTPAGRGGEVIRVTNLNPDGPGSLKVALEASGPRIVVFEVGGTIDWTSLETNVKITNPYITIAGQTAPSPGITIKGAAISIRTHDVLMQHLRVRVGDNQIGPYPGNRDALYIEDWPDEDDVYNVVVDHCSFSWSVDELASFWYEGVWNITVSNSIFSEPLDYSIHSEGKPHGFGPIIGHDVKNIAFIRNVIAHSVFRNPMLDYTTDVVLINNIIYNYRESGLYIRTDPEPSRIVFCRNYIRKGPNSSDHEIYIDNQDGKGTQIFLDQNHVHGAGTPSDQWTALVTLLGPSPRVNSPPLPVAGITQWEASDVLTKLLNPNNPPDGLHSVGARPTDKDAVDVRILSDVKNGTGTIINSQDDVGGWPNLPQTYRILNLPPNPNGDDDLDGYTNLEEWLHNLAAQVQRSTTSELSAPLNLRIEAAL